MNKYEIIISVCDTHSISKTAASLNYTQSAISQAIKSFEKELGFPLFKRSKHGMELMPNTEEIIASLKVICREKKKIRQIAANLTSLDSGYIRQAGLHLRIPLQRPGAALYPHRKRRAHACDSQDASAG